MSLAGSDLNERVAIANGESESNGHEESDPSEGVSGEAIAAAGKNEATAIGVSAIEAEMIVVVAAESRNEAVAAVPKTEAVELAVKTEEVVPVVKIAAAVAAVIVIATNEIAANEETEVSTTGVTGTVGNARTETEAANADEKTGVAGIGTVAAIVTNVVGGIAIVVVGMTEVVEMIVVDGIEVATTIGIETSIATTTSFPF